MYLEWEVTRGCDTFDIKQELFDLLDGIPANVTEQLVLRAVGEGRHSDHWLRKLLGAHDDEVVISEQVLIASMRPSSSAANRHTNSPRTSTSGLIIADNILLACAENCSRTAFEMVVGHLPDVYSNKTLVDMLVRAAVRKSELHLAIPKLELLNELYGDFVEIREDVLLSAASPLDYWRKHVPVHEV
jgi:hypothetical protein